MLSTRDRRTTATAGLGSVSVLRSAQGPTPLGDSTAVVVGSRAAAAGVVAMLLLLLLCCC